MKFITILAFAAVANAIRLHGEPPAKSIGNEGNKEQTMKEAEDRAKETQKELKQKADKEAAEKKAAAAAKQAAEDAKTRASSVVKADGLTYNNKGRYFNDGADKGKKVSGVNDWHIVA